MDGQKWSKLEKEKALSLGAIVARSTLTLSLVFKYYFLPFLAFCYILSFCSPEHDKLSIPCCNLLFEDLETEKAMLCTKVGDFGLYKTKEERGTETITGSQVVAVPIEEQ